MIIRRIAEALRRQDWATVTIEFILVVVGVLVALQFDNWNDERQNRLEERHLVSQLLGELKTAIDTKNHWITETDKQRQALADAIHVIQQTNPDSALSETLCNAAWQSHIIFFTTSQLATLDEILTTGRVRRLKDRDLRSTLLAFSDTRKRAAANLAFIRSDYANMIDAYPEAFPRILENDTPITTGTVSIGSHVACQLSVIRANQVIRNKLISNLARTTGALITAREEVAAMESLKAQLSETTP